MIPFGMIERAVVQLVVDRYPAAVGNIGGSPAYQRGDGLYVWVALLGGVAGATDGEWSVDVDIFADTYGEAMDHALAVEAALLGRPYGDTAEMRIDSITQNESPTMRPWGDASVSRVGGIYVFTARRSG